jgi:PEP-CTERM motif
MTVDITETATVVPEPATLVLFGTGAAGFIAKRRYRSRNRPV